MIKIIPFTELPNLLTAGISNLPFIFVDTCALLDLVRLPFRAKDARQAARTIEAARRFLQGACATPASAHLIAAERVEIEWKDNIAGVAAEYEGHVARMENDIDRFLSCASALGLPLPPLERTGPLLTYDLQSLAQDLLNASVGIVEERDIQVKAFHRESRGIGPAQKGKKCLGDCVVAETVLHSAEALRGVGFQGTLVFLTANTKDFSNGAGGLHQDLAADFLRLRIEFCTQWQHAAYSAGV